jgi:hypothetical protein
MVKKIKIMSISKNTKFNLTKIDGIDYVDIPDNKEKITTLYNREIENSKEYDFLVFMHGDVDVDLNHMIPHMIECSEKYDVMGLCGCQKMDVSKSPLNWFTGSMHAPEHRYGCVTHGEDKMGTSFFNIKKANITDISVACIDGLCIIFTKKAIASGLKFDEIFEFDFYDTDISFSAILKHKLNLGVIVEPTLKHYSVGKSILTNDFLKHEIDFRNKWKLDIPENSPIKKLNQ